MLPTLYVGPKDNRDNFATQGCLADAIANIDSDSLFKGDSLPPRPSENSPDQTQYEVALINFCDLHFWCDPVGWIKYNAGTSSICAELSEFPNHNTSSSFVYIDGTGGARCGLYKKSTRGWIKQ